MGWLHIRPNLQKLSSDSPGLFERIERIGGRVFGGRTTHNALNMLGMGNQLDQLGTAFDTMPGMRPHLDTATSSVETALGDPDAFSGITDKLNDPSNQQAISNAMNNVLQDKVPGFLQKSALIGPLFDRKSLERVHARVGEGIGDIGNKIVDTVGSTVENAIGLDNPNDLENNLTQLSKGSLPQPTPTATTPAGKALEQPITDAARNSIQSSVRSNMDFMPWFGMHMNNMFGKKSNITPDNDIVGAATAGREIASKITPSTPAMQNLGKSLADNVVNKPFDQFVEQKGNWALKGLHSFTKNPLGGVFDLISSFGDKPEEAAQ